MSAFVAKAAPDVLWPTPGTNQRKAVPEWQLRRAQREIECRRRLLRANREASVKRARDARRRADG
jgi:hypothetical protein